jgi:tetratricopeptide (TPR) repeat protein
MKKATVIFLFLILLVSLVSAQTVEEFMAKGDAAFDAFENVAALKAYKAAVALDSANCDALWKTARAHIDVGENAEEDIQKLNYYSAEKIARKAIVVCPDNDMAHLELAVAVGRVALMEGGKKKVELSREVKSEALKALELDPNNDIAHHVLARWHREVANLSGMLKMFAKMLYGGLPEASNETAVEHFTKAAEIDPSFLNHHLELGITYEKMKEWAKAKECYDKVIEFPEKDSDDGKHKAEAKERLKKVAKKVK